MNRLDPPPTRRPQLPPSSGIRDLIAPRFCAPRRLLRLAGLAAVGAILSGVGFLTPAVPQSGAQAADECAVTGAAISKKTVESSAGSVLYDYKLRHFRWHAGIGDYTLELELAPSVAAGDRIRIDFENVYAARPPFLEIDGTRVARSVGGATAYGADDRASTWVDYEFLPAVDGLVDRSVSISAFYEFYGLGAPPVLGENLAGRVSTCIPVQNGELGVVLEELAPMGVTSAYAATPGAALMWQLAHRADEPAASEGGRRIEVVLSNPHEYRLDPQTLRAAAYAVSEDRTRPIVGTEQHFDSHNGMTVEELPNGDVRVGFVAPKIRQQQRFVVHVTGGSAMTGQSLDPANRQIAGAFRVDDGAPVLVTSDTGYGSVSGGARTVGPPLFEKTLDGDRGYLLRISNPSSGASGYVVRAGTAIDRFFVNGQEAAEQLTIVEPSSGTVEGSTWAYPSLQPGESITASVPFDYAAWLEAGLPRIASSVNAFGLPGMGECVAGAVLLAEGTECSQVELDAPLGPPPALQIDKSQVGEAVLADDGASATVRYRIAVRNAGGIDAWAESLVVRDIFPADASGIEVVDPPVVIEAGLPETGEAAVPAGAPAGVFDPATGLWDGFSLNGGAVAAVEFTAELPLAAGPDGHGEHVNRATVEANVLPPRTDADPCEANETLETDRDRCDEVTTVLEKPRIASAASPEPGAAEPRPTAPNPVSEGPVPAKRSSMLAVTGGEQGLLLLSAAGGLLLVGGTAIAGAAVVRDRRRRARGKGSGLG